MAKLLFLFVGAFLSTPSAFADGIFRPAFTYTIDKAGSTAVTTTTRQLIDLPAGYLTTDGWAILGMYSMESKKVDNSSGSTTASRTSYGVGGGWYSRKESGPYIDAIYYISSTLSSPGTKYTGSGMQLDLGYKFSVSTAVSLGLQLSYRDFTYTKDNGTSLTTNYTNSNLDPMFAVVAVF